MKQLSRRYRLGVVGAGLIMVSSAADAATITLKAVSKNGTLLPSPTSVIDAVPGDRVEVDVMASGWGTDIDTVKTYQIEVDLAKLIDQDGPFACGTIKPINYDIPELRSPGLFIAINALNYGVCSAGSANAGSSCVVTTVPCTGGACVNGVCDAGTNAGKECATAYNQCDGGSCISRADFLMNGFQGVLCAADTVFAYRMGCTLLLDIGPADPNACVGGPTPGAPCDGDAFCGGGTCNVVEFYLGTVVLEVGADAQGSFTVDAVLGSASFLDSPDTTSAVLNTVPLTIQLGEPCGNTGACCMAFAECQDVLEPNCPPGSIFRPDTTCANSPDFCVCPTIVASSPANCAVDARYPHPPTSNPGSNVDRIGFRSVEVTLSAGAEMSLLEPSDFVLSFVGGGVSPRPVITAVTPQPGNMVRLDFDRALPIVPVGALQGTRWSCVGMACAGPSQQEVCWTHLPGDVDGDCFAGAADVLTLIDDLNGVLVPPLEWYQCDVDDSEECNAADVLAVIDLLNGAANFDPWINKTCNGGDCPTAP